MNLARAGLLPVIFAKFSYLAASVNLIWTLFSNASTLVAISHFLMQKQFTGIRQNRRDTNTKNGSKMPVIHVMEPKNWSFSLSERQSSGTIRFLKLRIIPA